MKRPRSRLTKKFAATSSRLAPFDWTLILIVMVMVIIGVLMVFDASYMQALDSYNDVFYFARKQAIWALVGLMSMSLAMHLPLPWLKRAGKPLFLISVFLLFLVLLPPFSERINGARRWLNLGIFSLQPSELTKLALALYLPTWLLKSKKTLPFIILMGLVLFLILLQPDMGTAVVVAGIIGSAFILSGAPVKKIIAIMIIGAVSAALLIGTSDYRRQRLTTFLNPGNDPLGSSYHIRQILLSYGSGGVMGTGLGRSRQKFQYLPEVSTDSIFAVIAEEMGLWGGALTITGFGLIAFKGWQNIARITDPYARILAGAIITWISLQAAINLSAMVALIPLTGIPLPFFSYGGSSLVMVLTAFGLYQNSLKYRPPPPKK
jgi:cell division protein FtsW